MNTPPIERRSNSSSINKIKENVPAAPNPTRAASPTKDTLHPGKVETASNNGYKITEIVFKAFKWLLTKFSFVNRFFTKAPEKPTDNQVKVPVTEEPKSSPKMDDNTCLAEIKKHFYTNCGPLSDDNLKTCKEAFTKIVNPIVKLKAFQHVISFTQTPAIAHAFCDMLSENQKKDFLNHIDLQIGAGLGAKQFEQDPVSSPVLIAICRQVKDAENAAARQQKN